MKSFPDTVERFTALHGDGDEIDRAFIKTSVAFHALPEITSSTTPAGLPSLDRVRANGVEWRFDDRILPFQLLRFDGTDLSSVAVILADSLWTSAVVNTDTTSVFDVTYSSAAGDSVRVKAEAKVDDRGLGYLEFSVTSITLMTANWTIAGYDFPRLAVKPNGDYRRHAALSPYLQGDINTKAFNKWPGGPLIAWYPGDGRVINLVTSNVTVSYPAEGGALNQQPASMQFTHMWNLDTDVGLMVVAMDSEGFLKGFRQEGDGRFHYTSVRNVPSNARARTSLSAGDYAFRVYPMAGDYEDACEVYRQVVVEDLEPDFLSGVKLLEDVRLESSGVGWGVGESGQGSLFANSYAMVIGQFDPTDAKAEGLQLSEMQAAMTRLKSFLGFTPEASLVYGASDIEFGLLENDQWSNFGEGIFTWLKNTFGATHILRYTQSNLFAPNSTWYSTQDSSDPALGWTTALTAPSNFVPVNAAGNTPKGNTDTTGAARTDGDRYPPRLSDSGARNHIVDILNRRFVTGDAGNGIAATAEVTGFYMDAFTCVQDGGDDYDASISANNRGHGAPLYWAGMRSLCKLIRTTFRALAGADFNIFSEWPSEMGLHMDGMSVPSNPLNQGLLLLPQNVAAFNRVWGSYQARSDFDAAVFAVGTEGLTSHPVAELPVFGDVDRLTFAASIHQGQTVMFYPFYLGRPQLIQDDPGDDGYSIWQAHRGVTMAMIRDWLAHLRAHDMLVYWNGRQLRWPDGSAMRNLARNDFDITVASNGTLVTEGVEWFGSVWAHTRNNFVRVVLSTAGADTVTASFSIDRDRYPLLPGGDLRVDELNADGTRTNGFATFSDVWEVEVELEARGLRIFEIRRDIF